VACDTGGRPPSVAVGERCDDDHPEPPTAATSDGCTAGSDHVCFETSRSGSDEPGALGTDVDWTEGQCFELGADNPERVDCAVPGTDAEEAGPTLRGTSDGQDCEHGGIPHADRGVVVGLTTVTAS
jgi:hypothetical protein